VPHSVRGPLTTYALVQASLLGRAYALLAGQNVETDHPYLRDLEEDDYVGVDECFWHGTGSADI